LAGDTNQGQKKGNKTWGTPFDFGTLSSGPILVGSTTSIYPNPVKDILHFSRPGTYEVCDITGKLLLRAIDATQLDVSSLSPGIYFITDSEGRRAKIVKE